MHTPDEAHLLFLFSKNSACFPSHMYHGSDDFLVHQFACPAATATSECSQCVFETTPFKLFCLPTPHVYQVTLVSWDSRSSEWPVHRNVNSSVFDHNRLVIIPVAKLICGLCQHCSLGFGLISLLCGFILSFGIVIIFFYSSWSVNIGVVNLLTVDWKISTLFVS